MSNRDAVVHLRIVKDSLQRFMKVTSSNENRLVPEKDGKVRILYSSINWYVTMSAPKAMRIVYTFEADPGGDLLAWLENSFADKGPYESFRKLSEILKSRWDHINFYHAGAVAKTCQLSMILTTQLFHYS